MFIHSSPRLSILVAAVCVAPILPGLQRTAHGQAQKGRLQRLGGPASLLRQPLSSMRDLRVLEEPERLRWQPAFRGEEVRRGPSQQWLEGNWSLRLAAVNDTIYRVTVETVLTDKAGGDNLLKTVNALLQSELGQANQEECSDFRWSAEDGDALLQFSDVAEGRRVTVVFTSNIVRTFTPH